MKKKTATKIMSYLLTTAMIVGGLSLSPLTTVEVMAGDPTPKNINLNVSNKIAGLVTDGEYSGKSTIYYASEDTSAYPWKIVNVPETGRLTLFSTGFIGANHQYDGSGHQNWSGSAICTYLNNDFLTTYFTDIEKSSAAISDYGVTESTNGYDNIDISQQLVLPSVEEVEAGGTWGLDNSARSDSDWWWLRSPGSDDFDAADVFCDGYVLSGGLNVVSSYGVRPAFNLNLESVLFSSASGASKSSSFDSTSSGSGISSWNLTLQDGTNFAASRKADETGSIEAGTKMNVTITNAPSGNTNAYTQTSAMLLDSNNTVICYGQIKNGAPNANDDIEITIPSSVPAGTYTMKVFAEDVNSTDSSNLTDYASNMAEIPNIQITAASTPPTPQTPPSSDDRNSNSDSDSNSDSSSTTTEEAYVNPLSWYYEANPLGSMCLIEHQGPVCVKAFNDAMPKGYKEAFSFNILLRENGIFKPSHVKKSGKFVLNIPKEWQKPGRKFILIGIDKFGNTKIFSVTDFSDETFTTMLDVEGYAFSLIYTDEPVTKK